MTIETKKLVISGELKRKIEMMLMWNIPLLMDIL